MPDLGVPSAPVSWDFQIRNQRILASWPHLQTGPRPPGKQAPRGCYDAVSMATCLQAGHGWAGHVSPSHVLGSSAILGAQASLGNTCLPTLFSGPSPGRPWSSSRSLWGPETLRPCPATPSTMAATHPAGSSRLTRSGADPTRPFPASPSTAARIPESGPFFSLGTLGKRPHGPKRPT